MDLILDVAEKEMVGIYWLLTFAIWHFLTIIELQKRHDISYLVALIQKFFPQIRASPKYIKCPKKDSVIKSV